MSVRPLALWPWPLPDAVLATIRQEFIALAPPFGVAPVEAVPGGPVRVLAVGSAPPWLCDHALLQAAPRPEAVRAALAWALEIVEEDPRATLLPDMLDAIMPGVREI